MVSRLFNNITFIIIQKKFVLILSITMIIFICYLNLYDIDLYDL